MPSSNPDTIEPIKRLLGHPSSILDLGAGWGSWGRRCREMFPAARIDAIEVHAPYLEKHTPGSYSNTYVTEAREFLERFSETWDLALLVGVIEHFAYEDGQRVLELCHEKARKTIVVTPAKPQEQGPKHDNEYERHVSVWTPDDFVRFRGVVTDHKRALIVSFGGADA